MNNLYDSGNNYVLEEDKKEEQPLGILNLEIEKGVIKQIKIYKNSNPEEVSIAFCKENNIDLSLMSHIKNEIESLLQKYFQSMQNEQNQNNNILQKDNDEQENNKNYIYNNNHILNNEYNSIQSINQPKNNITNNNEMNKRKLFFYQFLQNKNMRKTCTNKPFSVNKYKIKIFNTITNTKKNHKTKINNPESRSLKYINDSYLTQNYNTINNNKNSNIFNRLYNDAKIKRVVYKRPCHYSSHSKEKNIFQDNKNNIYETINGKTIYKNNLDMNPSYIRSYQIKPNKLLNNECSFQPNSFKNRKINYSLNNNSYQLNRTHYSHNYPEYRNSNHKNNIYQETIKSNDNYKNKINADSNSSHYNNLNFEPNKKDILYEENYKPLKDKNKYFSIVDNNQYINSEDMEMQYVESFSNLFNLLINNDQNQILNKNTLNINNIDNNTVLILSTILQDINNNEIELNLKNFIERAYKDLSDEQKKYLLINYSNVSNNNSNTNRTNNDNNKQYSVKTASKNRYFYGYNTSNKYSNKNFKTSTNFNSKKKFRLTSGTEKKKNFYYL